MAFYGQFGEDAYMSSLFPTEYKGVCVEVGAYDGTGGSNTYHFEQKGWKCLCVEPNPTQFAKCKAVRKVSVNCCVGAENAEDVAFQVYNICGGNESAISSLKPDSRLIASHSHMIGSTYTIRVKVRTLTDILDQANFPTYIDFISVDTENTELDVLKGFDFSKYTVQYFIIENNYDEPFCGEFLATHGYTKIHRTGVNDFYKRSQ
jgi:FkbM family methyltransferase